VKGVVLVRLIGACAAAVVLASGCGGDGGGAETEGADRVPASADLFAAINTDFEGEQWQTASDLLEKFPGGDLAVQSFLDSAEEDDVDFERDIKPAIGPELDIVIVEFPTGGAEPDVVALTQPRDREKFDALMEKGDEPAVYEIVDDWAVIAETQEAIDRFQQAAEEDTLGGSDAFEAAMDDLPDDALAKVYVNVRALSEIADTEAQVQTEELQECAPGGQASAFGAAVRAEQEGVRFDAAAPTAGGEGFPTYAADLPEEVPSGALAYFSFNNLADPIRDFLRCAGERNEDVDRGVAQLELALGVSLEEDILPLLENEGAITVYRGGQGEQIPAVSLVLEVENETEALETLDRLAGRADQFIGGVDVSETEVDGVTAKRVTLPDGDFSLLYAVFDGKLVVTTAEAGIAALRADGEKLADDDVYEQALDAADAPDETTGFAYANLQASVDYVLALIDASGDQPPPPQIRDNLEPLQSFLLYGSSADDEVKVAGAVRVE
jgi:hypothetical protein